MEIEEINEGLLPVSLPTINPSSGSTSRTSYTVHKSTPTEENILTQLEIYKDSTILLKEIVNKLVTELLHYT
ncbi:7872_t:CDS:1, partial [Scutellospora calospora]